MPLLCLIAVVLFSLMLSHRAYASVSALLEIKLGPSAKIYGLTASDSLGKKTGTLKEFAESVITANTTSYAVFPANFFNAYDDTKEIVGGIYSQHKIINDSWFDYGCGFDANNNFHMFSLNSLASYEPEEKIVAKDIYGMEHEIVTAFNCYPWLIKNDAVLDIVPTPGADENYLNRSALRAFMGQKSDGTFVYGIVSSATIRGTQDAAAKLGLINAVNTDGGASAGLYKDGEYLAHPGRELASVVCIVQEGYETLPAQLLPDGITMTAEAHPTASTMYIDGRQTAFDAYNIGGSNYFKLRDIANALNDTAAQFNVTLDNGMINLRLYTPYVPVGGEMALGDGTVKSAILNANPVMINGNQVYLNAYIIGGNNYFKLIDLTNALDFTASYENGAIFINTSASGVIW
jgi:hypothetical protein